MEKTFDPCAWPYRMSFPHLVAQSKLIEGLDRTEREQLGSLLHRFGGKVFGLRLCERIATHCENLVVPPWLGIQVTEIMYQDMGVFIQNIPWLEDDERVILRSSAHDEDWISPRSGTFRSPVTSKSKLRSKLIDAIALRIPHVIQKHVDGLGVVVDIGWSLLLQQPVVRIAAGREYRVESIRRFSSATSDHEGPIVVLDLEGHVLIEPQRGEVLVDQPVDLPYDLLAKELARAVATGIGSRFGVQLELIIHPDRPLEWSLVQIRPTPGHVRTVLGRLVARTAAVSGSFRHRGTARVLTRREQIWLMRAESIDPDDPDTVQEGIQMLNGSTIFVWENDPHTDYGLFQMRMLHRLGAIGQITRNALTMNTSHGVVQQRIDPSASAQHELVHTCALLGLRTEDHARLVATLRQGPCELEIVSDGLIGEVYLID